MKRAKKIIIIVLILIVLIAAGVLTYLHMNQDRFTIEDDMEKIATTEYNTVFLSMYPVKNYNEEEFAYYREMYLLKTAYSIPDIETLHTYLDAIFSSGNEVTTLYLGIRPELIDPYEIASIIELYPGLQYKILLASPSLNYWAALPEEEFAPTLQAYGDFVNPLLPLEQVEIFTFFNTDWLISNPGHYESDFLLNEAVSSFIFLNADADHDFLLTIDNAEEVFTSFYETVEEYRLDPPTYPDLSDYELVFFGDSVIGNYRQSLAIPGMVGGLTGAQYYNLGHGGASAAEGAPEDLSLPKLVDAFISKDTTLLDPEATSTQIMQEYHEKWFKKRDKAFVISFGLNDYFEGYPVSSSDPYDITTYSGALRTGIKALQEEYPDAYILLLTPNFCSYFENGTIPQNSEGGVLIDYVNAVTAIGEEMNVDVLDVYRESGIDESNWVETLEDGCHPTTVSRLEISYDIIEVLEKLATTE